MRHVSGGHAFNIFSTNGYLPDSGPPAPSGTPQFAQGRADHARMLAHAAKRRRAAQALADHDPHGEHAYWKACAPTALRRAIAIRREAGLAKLP